MSNIRSITENKSTELRELLLNKILENSDSETLIERFSMDVHMLIEAEAMRRLSELDDAELVDML